jgi:hypothetical protein
VDVDALDRAFSAHWSARAGLHRRRHLAPVHEDLASAVGGPHRNPVMMLMLHDDLVLAFRAAVRG